MGKERDRIEESRKKVAVAQAAANAAEDGLEQARQLLASLEGGGAFRGDRPAAQAAVDLAEQEVREARRELEAAREALEALEKGLDWAWRGFGDWLDRFEGNMAVNAGFLVGHCALRRPFICR